MRKKIIAGVLLVTSGSWAGSEKTEQPPTRTACTGSIDQPAQGENVGPDGDVAGHAAIPPGTFAWILAHKKSINGYWPQANGAVQIESDGSFRAFVTYGKDGEKGPFEVILAIVDEPVNRTLERWVDRASETGRYPPISFPNVHTGCPIVRVIVTRQ